MMIKVKIEIKKLLYFQGYFRKAVLISDLKHQMILTLPLCSARFFRGISLLDSSERR